MQGILTKIKFILLALIIFIIPGYIYVAPLCIILYTSVWLLEGNILKKFRAWTKNKYALLFSGLYVLYALGLLFTPDLQSGTFTLQVKLSLGLFPLLLVSEGEFDIKKQRILIRAFISGCVANAFICLGKATLNYVVLGTGNFTYMQFSLFLHPSYYSMYNDIALLLIFYLLTDKKSNPGRKEKIFLSLIFIFLLFIIILLESKTGWICTVLLLMAFLLKLFMNKTYRKTSILLLSAGLALGFLAFYSGINNGSRFNIVKTLASTGKWDSTSGESTQARHFAWIAATKLISKQPVIGYGTGEAWAKLQEQYTRDNYTGPLQHLINAHNQYLQTALDIGISGSLYLILCLVIPLIKVIKEKKFYYGMFIGIFMLNIMVESMLEQQSGTMFYGLFNSLFMFNFVI